MACVTGDQLVSKADQLSTVCAVVIHLMINLHPSKFADYPSL